MSAAVTLLLAATFLAAAIAKFRAPQPFVATLQTLIGARWAGPVARVVPVGELVLAAALLAGVAPRLVAAIVLIVLAAFSLVLMRIRSAVTADGSVLPCNCFGAGDGDPATGLVRNGLLGVLTAALIAWPVGGPVWDLDAGALAASATVALGAACVWHLAVALRPLVRLVQT
jgi:uncharacterized membrane protein YphA (DoxX/SURF4 family)